MIKFLSYSKTNFKERLTKEILKKKSKSVVVLSTYQRKIRKTRLRLRNVRQKNSKRNRLLKDRQKSKWSKHRGKLIYRMNKKMQKITNNEKKRSGIRKDRLIRFMFSRFYNRLKRSQGHLPRLVLLLSGIDY